MRRLRVLLACEMSGRVRNEFAARGWEAWSADLLPCESPDFNSISNGDAHHYQGDVRDLFRWDHPVNNDRNLFGNTAAGKILPLWDMVIGFPPCTDLSLAGARWWPAKRADGRQARSIEFFMDMVCAPSPLVAVENPRGIMKSAYREPDQVIHPWWFGDAYSKATCLWLKGLPLLVKHGEVEPEGKVVTSGSVVRADQRRHEPAVSGGSGVGGRPRSNAYEDSEGRKMRHIVRSRTFPGVAREMAAQWGAFAEDYYAKEAA